MNQSSAFNHNFNNENCESVDGNVRVLVKNRFRDVTCYVNLGEVRTSPYLHSLLQHRNQVVDRKPARERSKKCVISKLVQQRRRRSTYHGGLGDISRTI